MSENHPQTPDDSKLKSPPADQLDAGAKLAYQPGGAAETEDELNRRFWIFNVTPSWLVSFFTHIALFIFLAIWLVPQIQEQTISFQAGDQISDPIDELNVNLDEMEIEEADPFETEMTDQPPVETFNDPEPITLDQELFDQGDVFMEESPFETGEMGELSDADLSTEIASRSSANKKELLRKYGGTAASEKAVAMALKWIADSPASRRRLEL